MPKRFLLFTYNAYYPAGGWSDLYDTYDTLDEAKAAWAVIKAEDLPDCHQIIDLQTGEEVDDDV